MPRLKIIHVIPSLNKGGAERLVVDLCNALKLNPDLDVTLVSLFKNDAFSTFVSELESSVNYVSFNKKPGLDLKCLFQLNLFFNQERPDVIHTHINAFEYTIPYRLFRIKTKYFHTIHCLAKDECPNKITKFIRKWIYSTSRSKPITISKEGTASFEEYYKLNNSILIENGTRDLKVTEQLQSLTKQYKENSDTFLMVNIARIVPEKNQGLLIDAVNLFNSTEKKKIKLLVIGDERDKALKEELLSKNKDNPNINFLGGRSNVADYLSIADAFCLSSIHEGMPISLIESLSMGCIPICTPVGGMKEMINHGQTGYLAKGSTAELLSETFKQCLYSINRSITKENCRKEFKTKYDIKLVAKRHENSYRNISINTLGN